MEGMAWIMCTGSSARFALRAEVEVFTIRATEPYTEDGLREKLLASNPPRSTKRIEGPYLLAVIALNILMNILILDATDNVEYTHQRGRRWDVGVFHDGNRLKIS